MIRLSEDWLAKQTKSNEYVQHAMKMKIIMDGHWPHELTLFITYRAPIQRRSGTPATFLTNLISQVIVELGIPSNLSPNLVIDISLPSDLLIFVYLRISISGQVMPYKYLLLTRREYSRCSF